MATTKKRRGVKTGDTVSIPNPGESSAPATGSASSSNIDNGKSPQDSAEILASAISIQEKVALLAYSYWQERGCQGGCPEEDWFRAEREILSQLSASGQ